MLHVMPDVRGTLLGNGLWLLEVLHLQFGKEARLYLCIDKWNCPTQVHRQLSLTQAVQSKLNPTGLALVMGMKAQIQDVLSQYSMFIYNSSTEKCRCIVWQECLIE